MFTGSVNQYVRKWFIDHAAAFTGRRVVVGCSGNFTFEALLGKHAQPAEIHSNDVSLYSCTLGGWLAGRPLELTAKPGAEWLAPYLDEPDSAAASVLLLSGMLPYLRGATNAHKARIVAGYVAQWPRLYAATLQRIQAIRAEIRIADFFAGDVAEHYRRFAGDRDALFVAFPPTYRGGYEKMFEVYDKLIAWAAPAYPLLDDERLKALLEWLLERDFVWIDDRRLAFEPAFSAADGRLRTQYVYSNVFGDPGLKARATKLRDPKLALCRELRADSRLTVKRVPTEVFEYFRATYLNKGIAPAGPTWCFLVMVDNCVAGALGFSQGQFEPFGPAVYMLSDFAISPPPHPRLSKLVVMAALSREVHAVIERERQLRTTRLITTAFTTRPVSMKYRGVLTLDKRAEDHLQYSGAFTALPLQEVYAQWWRKYPTSLAA